MNADASNLFTQTVSATATVPGLDIRWLSFICAALLALAFLAWWKSRRLETSGRSPIRILGSRMLGGKRWLTLVEVEGTRLLLAVAANEMWVIKTFGAGHKREEKSEEERMRGERKVRKSADPGGEVANFTEEAGALRLPTGIRSRRRSG